MRAIQNGDRQLFTAWSLHLNLLEKALDESNIWDVASYAEEMKSAEFISDTTKFIMGLISDARERLIKDVLQKLPNNVYRIGVFLQATSPSVGYLALEYNFANITKVEEKADSVF